MTDVFERVGASVPSNATAARVTSKGTHYEPTVNYGTVVHMDLPPPCVPIPPAESAQGILGRRFGRFVVVGLAAEQNQKKKSRWVVRCACGDYEFRKAKAIRNPINTDDCCKKCKQAEINRKRYARLGSRPVEDFTTKPGATP